MFQILYSFVPLFGLLPVPASAAPVHEVWVHQGPVTPALVERWNADRTAHTRELLIEWETPQTTDLDQVLRVTGMTRIRLETPRAPRADLERWKRLAEMGVEWIGLSGDFPTESELERLREIRFPKTTFVLSNFPQPADGARLAKLETPLALSFNAGKLPTFSTKPGFEPLGHATPLLFVADYWPFYSHMDFFNLIPQPVRLRIRDSFPYGMAIEYLAHIQRLEEIAVQVDFEPSRTQWESLPQGVPLVWIPRNAVPTENALRTLEGVRSRAAPTRIVIDSNSPLTAAERARLERSSFAAEWIRPAPR